jgi:hypothetical protein
LMNMGHFPRCYILWVACVPLGVTRRLKKKNQQTENGTNHSLAKLLLMKAQSPKAPEL